MTRISLAFAAAVLFSTPLPAQPKPQAESLLDRLAGTWVLRGTIGGQDVTHDLEATWVLNREYLHLHEVSREKNAAGGPAYEAIVFLSWNPGAGEYTCLWLDSTGGGGLSAQALGHGKPGEDRIPFVFTAPNGSRFFNTFVYAPGPRTWQWIMEGEVDGKPQPFGRLKLTRP